LTIKVPEKTMQPEMLRGTDLEVALVRMSSEDVVRVRLEETEKVEEEEREREEVRNRLPLT